MKNKEHTAKDYFRIARTYRSENPQLIMHSASEIKKQISTHILKSIGKAEHELCKHQRTWLDRACTSVTNEIIKSYKRGWRYVGGHLIQQL